MSDRNNLQSHDKKEISGKLRRRGFFADLNEPVIVGHRGAWGDYPENTLLSFREALDKGADAVEMDVRITADGHVVVMHDATVDRTTDGKGRVDEMTLEEVRQLDAAYYFAPEKDYPYRGQGIRVPTLEEVLEVFPGRKMVIELKGWTKETVHRVADVIAKHKAEDRLLVISISDAMLTNFRDIMPEIPTCGGLRESLMFFMLSRMGAAGRVNWKFDCLLVIPGFGIFTEVFKNEAHAAGLHVYVSMLNDSDGMREYLEAGADGILTDYPAVLSQIVNNHPDNN